LQKTTVRTVVVKRNLGEERERRRTGETTAVEDKRERWDYDGHGLGELNQDLYRRQGRHRCRYERDVAMAALA
jgi:hypothetical protein